MPGQPRSRRSWRLQMTVPTVLAVLTAAGYCRNSARGVDNPTQDALFRQTALFLAPMFTSNGGVDSYTFEMKPDVAVNASNDAVAKAQEIIESRLRELGVTNPVVIKQGGAKGDLLRLSMPSGTDVARAKEIIRTTAVLELKVVEGDPAPTPEALLQTTDGRVPSGFEGLPGIDRAYYLVQKTPVVTGRDLLDAQPTIDDNKQPAVRFSLNAEGTRKYSVASGGKIGRLLAITIDSRVWSVSRIADHLFGGGRLSSRDLTEREAHDLALLLRSGALPASVTILEQGTTQPAFQKDSPR